MTYTGRDVRRLEDADLLRGAGRFADDLPVRRDTLHAAILRSPHAHADILSVDVEGALALPGVDSVVTAEDARRWTRPFVVALETPMQHWCRVVAAKYSPAVSNARVARRPVVRSYKRPAPSPSTQMGALRGYHPTNPMVAIERVCKGRLALRGTANYASRQTTAPHCQPRKLDIMNAVRGVSTGNQHRTINGSREAGMDTETKCNHEHAPFVRRASYTLFCFLVAAILLANWRGDAPAPARPGG